VPASCALKTDAVRCFVTRQSTRLHEIPEDGYLTLLVSGKLRDVFQSCHVFFTAVKYGDLLREIRKIVVFGNQLNI
jgi:hypothetical protein